MSDAGPPLCAHARMLACLLALLAAPACTDAGTSSGQRDLPAASAAPDPAAAHAAELVEAARMIIAFLRGDTAYEAIRLADTVTLHLSPEGGGAQVAMPRERLANRHQWTIPAAEGAVYPLVPPTGYVTLTTVPGVHFNCLQSSLASRLPELARLPHVGTRLVPDESASCLESWNLTLVFDSGTHPPMLIAAVYDQWEW